MTPPAPPPLEPNIGTPRLGGVDVRERFWMRVLYSRYLSATGLCVTLALLPQFGDHRIWFATAFAVMSAIQNTVLFRIVRRTGSLPRAVAASDYGFGAIVGIALPAIYPWVLLILATTISLIVIGFPRRFSYQLLGVMALPYLAIGVWQNPDGWIPAYAIWLICSLSTVLIIGLVADEERSLRTRYTDLSDQLDMVVWESGPRRDLITYVNDQVPSLLGYDAATFSSPGFRESVLHPGDTEVLERGRAEFEAGASHALEYRVRCADGSTKWVLELVHVTPGLDGRAMTARGVMLDVTTRKEAEQQVRQLGEFVADIPVALQILRMDDLSDLRSFRILAANQAAAEQAGIPLDRLLSWRPKGDGSTRLDPEMLKAFAHVIRTGEPLEIPEHERTNNAGQAKRFRIQATPLTDQAIGISIEDVTIRSAAATALRHQALHDSLTALPNRALLHDRLQTALLAAERSGSHVALMFMDLNQFKEVNDALGHHHGDMLLIELGKRLHASVRTCDTVARLGGDEFAVLLTVDVSSQGALDTARRIIANFSEPVVIDGVSLQTGVSIGIALSPDHGTEAELLTQRADVAMYKAKTSGAGVMLYSPEHDRSSVRRLTLLSDLRRAIEDEQLTVFYQPRIDLATGHVIDVEALVRWNHPIHGLLPPADFIELAEVSGSIQALTANVMRTATSEIGGLIAAGFDLGVAVNLSVRNLYDPTLLDVFSTALAESRLDPNRLRVELTESELMDDPALAMEVLGQIRSRGIEISVDDFGTGYSSLAYLRDLPISEIKIDRSFVADLVRGDSTLVRSIIDLGHNLGLRVVAEGVESGPALRQLADFRCDSAQGYFISRPVSLAELVPFLRRDGDHYRGWTRAAAMGPDPQADVILGRRKQAVDQVSSDWEA